MFQGNIKQLAKENMNFRHVLYTGNYSQVVLMSLAFGEDIGEEVHPNTDQILFLVAGQGNMMLDGESTKVEKHSAIFVPAGTKHNLTNTGDGELKLYTVYAPPAHADGITHATKADAQQEEPI